MKTFLNSLLLVAFLIPATLFAQTTLTGTVIDEADTSPIPGVNILVKGTTNGAATDFDGKYSIKVNQGDVLVFSYVGYVTQEVTYTGQSTIDISMVGDTAQLDEIVLIGYGSVKKEDATGSVDVVSSKDFNQGAIVSTDQLLNGKAAGVRITNNGGSPDSAPNIRIRGGASLNASNNPLIVIDGVPIGSANPAGVSNPLSLVNPNDIESFSILKDASATAIYGARASNGVIIITTKKGTSGEVKFNFNSDVSIGTAPDGLNMMNGNEYVRFIQEFYPNQVGLLGVPLNSVQTNENVSQIIDTPNGQRAIYDTDWRDAIYRTAITTNTNFSARANLFEKIPFRASVGYTNANGVVLNDDYERYTASFKLTPTLLDGNLKIDANAKAILAEKNAIDAGGAIGNAISFNPTQPVFNNAPNNPFAGFFENTIATGTNNQTLVDGGQNPLGILQLRDRPEDAFRFLGNVELDYSLPFVPGLKVVANIGLDASRSSIEERFLNGSIGTVFNRSSDDNGNYLFNPGVNYEEEQNITNTTFDFYTQYNKEYENGFLSKFDAQLGYSYQNFKNDGNQVRYQLNPSTGLREIQENPQNPNNRYFNSWNIQSFFGRTNFTLADKYLFTFSVRADASSLFVQDDVWDSDVWGIFPAAAFAWQIKKEKFLENVNFVSDLKLRLGWGLTGQQDVTTVGGVGFYPSVPLFDVGSGTSQYFPGAPLYSARDFNPDLTWETTTTYNIGLDFGFFNNRFSGSLDTYYRETEDLLSSVNVPPGQGLRNVFISNVGETESRGFELNLNVNPVETDNFSLNINGNISYNYTELTSLGSQEFLEDTGSNVRGTGTNLKYSFVGDQLFGAYVFKQIYDGDGNPIPGAFVDRNGDNVLDFEDRYLTQLAPNWTFGFGINFNYKNWDFSSSFRGQIGGNVFNLNQINYGFTESAVPQNAQSLNNVLNFYDGSANSVFTDYTNANNLFSDHFLEDASFLRCDNIALGHRFDNIIKNGTVRFYAAVTNPFLITDYSGQDPENFGGIDSNFYPRPTTYTFGLNLDF
jgi:iron complex outermembrane receptor protein